ncbi:hypothetical protein BD779DRAFT_1472351 [Infundibulicybe gibba]|nr:hypothetical protein BD779DRAFT_1472351 [Infundibulicybe gibba]
MPPKRTSPKKSTVATAGPTKVSMRRRAISPTTHDATHSDSGNSSDLPEDVFSLPPLKRKTADSIFGSDGDGDLPTTPERSPKKAKCAAPGSPEFNKLPSVSFEYDVLFYLIFLLTFPSTHPSPHLDTVSKQLSFGSVEDTPFDLATPPESPVPAAAQKRMTPSEKVRYMSMSGVADTPANTPTKSKNSLVRVYPDGVEVKYTPPWRRTSESVSPTKPSPSRTPKPPLLPPVQEITEVVDSEEEYESNAHLTSKVKRYAPGHRDVYDGYEGDTDGAHLPKVPRAQAYGRVDRDFQDQPVKIQAESMNSSDELSDYERAKVKGKAMGKKPANPFLDEDADDSGHEPEVPTPPQLIMRTELQDILLRPYYQDLPELTFCEIIPYPSAVEACVNKDGTMLLFSPLAERLSHRDEKARFFRATTFVSYNAFLNPARIAPSQAGSNQSPYAVKNISIFPLSQEYERSISCVGMAFGVKEFHGPLAGGALTLSTRTSNFPSSSVAATPGTPKTKGLFSATESSSSRRNTPYPASLGVEDTVPIYDGRALKGSPGFEFRGADFDRIRTLPLYRKGLADLPPYSVVSVGYTANTFPYKGTNAAPSALALSLNVLSAFDHILIMFNHPTPLLVHTSTIFRIPAHASNVTFSNSTAIWRCKGTAP